MKGKNLSIKDKSLLLSYGINVMDWLRVERTAECKTFINVKTGKIVYLRY